jgi:hypothetical protein
MTAWWALDAAVIEKHPKQFQRKVAGVCPAITIEGCPRNKYI